MLSYSEVCHFGIHKVDTIEAGEFRSDHYRDVLYDFRLNGRKFKFSGILPFSEIESKNTYMTHFGPCVHVKNRVVYGATVHNYSSMLLRIIGGRDLEETKTKNNKFISPNIGHRGLFRTLDSYFRKIKRNLSKYLDALGDNITEQIICACSPHVKRDLRIKAIRELVAKGELLNSLFMKDIKGKIKIPEFAKAGKKPRLIGDFTCPGSLLAGFLIPCIKAAFSEPIIIEGSRFRFVYSTDSETLDSIFTECQESIYNEFIYFSDDMCCCIKNNGEPRWFNLDISSCDASNGTGVFERLHWFFDQHVEHDQLLTRAILQCQQRLVIHHPNKSVKEVITAKCKLPIEFSGTQLTTALNNIAASSIVVSISKHIGRSAINFDQFGEIVARAALAVGYEVTIDPCRSLSDVQFLKHSFYQSEDGVKSFVNLGPIFRSMGTCWMDLPYNRKLGETLQGAAHFRNWSVLQGYAHSGLSPILDHLAKSPAFQKPSGEYAVLSTRLMKEKSFSLYQDSISKRKPAPLSAILERYDIMNDELEQMLNTTHQLNLMVYHSALKAQDLINFLKQKKRPQIGHFIPLLKCDPILLDDYNIQFDRSEIDSYLCARIIDYIRLEFLRLKISFTFETVMSHISKVEFLQEAQRQGFKTYLYYVSTVDPLINIAVLRPPYRNLDWLKSYSFCDRRNWHFLVHESKYL